MTVVVMEKPSLQKSHIQKWLDELPENIPLDQVEELIDKLRFLHGLEQAEDDIRNGRLHSHEEVMSEARERIKKWRK